MSLLASVEFKRIIFEEWVLLVVIASFVVVGSVFLLATLWVMLLPKDQREHIANLPLEDDAAPIPHSPTPTPKP